MPKIKTKIVSEYFHSKYKHPITNKTFTPPTNNNQTYITEDEVKTEISCLKNGKACGFDNMKAVRIKSGTAIYKSALTELLNEIVNEQKSTENITDGNLILLQKPNKPKGNIKNLKPIIFFSTIRKTLSTIALRRIRNDVDAYLSASQFEYHRGRSTSDIVWTHKWLSALIQKKRVLKY